VTVACVGPGGHRTATNRWGAVACGLGPLECQRRCTAAFDLVNSIFIACFLL
jgi:hypothetical protein